MHKGGKTIFAWETSLRKFYNFFVHMDHPPFRSDHLLYDTILVKRLSLSTIGTTHSRQKSWYLIECEEVLLSVFAVCGTE